MHDPIASALTTIMNNEERGKKECIVTPAPKLLANVLRVLQKHGYIGEFEYIDDGRFGKFRIQLLGKINKCGVVKPRFSVSYKEIEEWVKKYLPSKDVGILIITTSKGLLTHKEVIENRIGGQLLAYVY
ncbi:MAG: 30S ribosomal protein S8 [Candidatus Methanomethylicota archaeon]|jgi:small subunit ribosomal protein S8|uniref:Small ribosomal subunit protein uS8 n=1 Tax=Thermoproteota archaeon TaxID=2056631 RepID=A0A520KEC1_9CREN|nr:MAG: 30S ribosomal protein S8 [Candidatus Verstraetearchaeota archaeon]TDA38402.1 MAG: 30S ribosomal protein S8 [Candidatus Verstraetearchaeota archaeon]